MTGLLFGLACHRHPDQSGSTARSLEPIDLLVHGGTIHTVDVAMPRATAMAVQDGRILAVGGDELATRFEPKATLDLAGRTVIPGLIDAHAHFLGLGRTFDEVDLRDTKSYDALVARVAAAAARLPEGEFVLGRGWNQELWPDEQLPVHAALSAATPRHPVLLRRVDGHATLANARALELGGITTATVSPLGGEILRDRAGQLTGVLVDAASELLPKPPGTTDAQRERWALAAQRACLAVGLTGVHDAGSDEAALATVERLAARGELLVRLNVMLEADFDATEQPRPWLAAQLAAGPRRGMHGGRISVTAVKHFADGALGSRGAALLEAYADRPESRGLMQLSPESLEARVRACRNAGFQSATHAIGDAANRMALDVYERVLGETARTEDHRFRIEHAQVIHPEDLPRFLELGVTASFQPTHATSDMNMAGERLGDERLVGAYAWRALELGAVALGSDFPVESENPFWGLYAATTRTDHRGKPAGGWRPQDLLTRQEALRGFTLDAARASFDEDRLGSLSPGKRADFVVVPLDPLECKPSHLLALRPDSTWIDGRQVFPQ